MTIKYEKDHHVKVMELIGEVKSLSRFREALLSKAARIKLQIEKLEDKLILLRKEKRDE